MIHQRQRLAFLLEPRQDRPRIHSGLDQLKRDLALHWLGLAGGPDLAHASFAELFQQCVSIDDNHTRRDVALVVGRLVGLRRLRGVVGAASVFLRRVSRMHPLLGIDRRSHSDGRVSRQVPGLCMCGEECFHSGSKFWLSHACLVKEAGTFFRGLRNRFKKERLFGQGISSVKTNRFATRCEKRCPLASIDCNPSRDGNILPRVLGDRAVR